MFFYSYLFRSNKHFKLFYTVLQVLLDYINTCAGLTSSLRNFCRDHPRRKSNTSIKKRSPHQQHHTGSRNQGALRRCGARASIIFPCFSCLYTYLPTTNTTSSLLAVLVLWCQWEELGGHHSAPSQNWLYMLVPSNIVLFIWYYSILSYSYLWCIGTLPLYLTMYVYVDNACLRTSFSLM